MPFPFEEFMIARSIVQFNKLHKIKVIGGLKEMNYKTKKKKKRCSIRTLL